MSSTGRPFQSFLTHKFNQLNSVNMSSFKQVRPEDFDVEKLLAASREGRLYVDVKKTLSTKSK